MEFASGNAGHRFVNSICELDSSLLSGSVAISIRLMNRTEDKIKQGGQPGLGKPEDRKVTSAVTRCTAASGASRYDGGLKQRR
jgi:hypothetical protein